MKKEYMKEEKESAVLIKNVDEYSSKLQDGIPTTLYYLNESDAVLNKEVDGAFEFKRFLGKPAKEITVKNKANRTAQMTKSKDELVKTLFYKIKEFTDKFFSDKIDLVNYFKIEDINVEEIIREVYNIDKAHVK